MAVWWRWRHRAFWGNWLLVWRLWYMRLVVRLRSKSVCWRHRNLVTERVRTSYPLLNGCYIMPCLWTRRNTTMREACMIAVLDKPKSPKKMGPYRSCSSLPNDCLQPTNEQLYCSEEGADCGPTTGFIVSSFHT